MQLNGEHLFNVSWKYSFPKYYAIYSIVKEDDIYSDYILEKPNLKSGEGIFFLHNTKFDTKTIVKINVIDKYIYFLKDNTNDELVFTKKGLKAKFNDDINSNMTNILNYLKEDAMATGSIGGMGTISNSGVGSQPGLADGSAGSGDLSSTLGTDVYIKQPIPDLLKPKKNKEEKECSDENSDDIMDFESFTKKLLNAPKKGN